MKVILVNKIVGVSIGTLPFAVCGISGKLYGHAFVDPARGGPAFEMTLEQYEEAKFDIIGNPNARSQQQWIPCFEEVPAPVSDEAVDGDAEKLAIRFHNLYETMAPQFGYETRPESNKPWSEVPEANRNLMIAVCKEILGDRDTSPTENGEGISFRGDPVPAVAPRSRETSPRKVKHTKREKVREKLVRRAKRAGIPYRGVSDQEILSQLR